MMYKLEDRILFDGAAVADVVDAQHEAEAQQEAAQATEAEEAAQHETADSTDNNNSDGEHHSEAAQSLTDVLAAIGADGLGADGQRVDVLLISDSLENADDISSHVSENTIVVRYDARTTSAADLMQQITDALGGNVADSIGFVTESGENAHVQLFADTDTSLDTVNDSVHQNFFNSLDALLDENGQVNLFASNLASTAEGKSLVNAIGDSLSHDVAASIDETGSESAGGDWDLEYSTNGLEVDTADVYFGENLIDNFDSLLEDHVSHEVAFINSSVMDVDSILDDLGDNVEIVMIQEGRDGLDQITDYLQEHSDTKYDAVHILTHGNEGYFVLNGQVVDSDYVNENASDFVQWRNALSDDADVMIYGCNLAGNQDGQNLVANIASLTGADVAASIDSVGGSDWSLEYNFGDVNYGHLDIDAYSYHLADQLVTNDADTGAGSLRAAISIAATGDSVTFDGDYDIALSSTLNISGKAISIKGGTNSITVSSAVSNVFTINETDPVSSLTVSNISIICTSPASYAVYVDRDGTFITSSSINITGGIFNNGTVSIGSSTETPAHSVLIAGDIVSYGTFTIEGGGVNTVEIIDDISNFGTFTVFGDNAATHIRGNVSNYSLFTFDGASDLVDATTIDGTIDNYNTLVFSGDTGVLYVNNVINHTAELIVSNSTIVETISGQGRITVNSGALLSVSDTIDIDNAELYVNGTLRLDTGAVLEGNGTFTVDGIFRLNQGAIWNQAGEFNSGTGEVYFENASADAAQVHDLTYYDLTLAGTGSFTWGNQTVTNKLSLDSIWVYVTDLSVPTLFMKGDSELHLTGDLDASLTYGTVEERYGDIYYEGNNDQYIAQGQYNNLFLEGNGSKILSGDIYIIESILGSNRDGFTHNNKAVYYNSYFEYNPGLNGQQIAGLTYYDLVIAGGDYDAENDHYTVKKWDNDIVVDHKLIFASDAWLVVGPGETMSQITDDKLEHNDKGRIIYYQNDEPQDIQNLHYHDLTFYGGTKNLIDDTYVSGHFRNYSTVVGDYSFVLDGTAWQSFDDANFYDLIFEGNGIKTAFGDINVRHDLTFADPATLEMTAGSLVWAGGSSGGIFTHGNGTIIYSGDTTQTIQSFYDTTDSSQNYYNLILSGAGDKILGGNIGVVNEFHREGFTVFDANGYKFSYLGGNQTIETSLISYYDLELLNIDAPGSEVTKLSELNLVVSNDLIMGADTALDIAGSVNIGNNVSLDSASTILYSGDNQIVADIDYQNLKIVGKGTKTWEATSGNLNFTTLTIEGEGNLQESEFIVYNTLDMASRVVNVNEYGIINIKGNIIKDLDTVFTAADNSTVRYSSNADQGIAGLAYYNLVLAAGGASTKTLEGDISIAGNFLINPGVFFDYGSQYSVTYNGGDQDIAAADYYEIILAGSGTKTWNSSITAEDLTFAANVLLVVPNQLDNLTTVNTNSTGTIKYIGSGNVQNLDFWNLELAGTGYSFAPGWSGSIGNDFTVSAGNVSMSSDMHILGDVSITGSGVLDSVDTYNLAVDGNWNNTGSFLARNATVTFGNNSSHILTGDTTFNNLVIDGYIDADNQGGKLEGNSDITLTGIFSSLNGGTVNMSGGNFTYDGTDQTVISGTYYDLSLGSNFVGTLTAVDVDVSNDLIFNADAIFAVSGDLSIGNALITNNLGLVEYIGNDQNVVCSAGNYNNLIISGSGIKTADSALTVDNDLTINSTLDANAALEVTGNIAGNGTLLVGDTVSFASITGQSTVVFDGDDSQTVNADSYYNLSINNGNKALAGDVTVANDFSFNSTAGLLDIGIYSLVVVGEIDGALGGSSYFLFSDSTQGTLTITIDADGYKALVIGADYSGTPEWSAIRLFDESGVSNTISIRAFAHITSDGTPGGMIIDSNSSLNMTFEIEANTGSFNMMVDDSSVKGEDFSPFFSELKFYSGGWQDAPDPATSTGSYYFGSYIAPGEYLYVTSLADDGSTGTLRKAIAYANLNDGIDKITFAASLFTSGSGTINLNAIYSQIAITDSLIIEGPGALMLTIDGAATSVRVFNISNDVADIYVSISGLTIANGNAGSFNGGGIYNNEMLVMNDVVLSGSTAVNGGGIYNDFAGSIFMDRVKISSNGASSDGGGIYNHGGSIQAENLWMTGNTADRDGAGIYNAVYTVGIGEDASTNIGEIILENTTLDNNIASGNGGAFYNQGKLYGENLTLVKNVAVEGSAIYVDGQTTTGVTSTTLFNSTIALNEVTSEGGSAIFRSTPVNDNLYVNSSLFAGNFDSVGNYYDISNNSTNYIGGTALNNYFIGDAAGIFNENNPSDHGGWVATLELNTANITVQDHILDKSMNDGSTIYDARGFMRYGARDIGAFEAGYAGGSSIVTGAYVARNVDRNLYYTSVQAAIEAAESGENIELFGTRYHITSELSVGKELIITGQGKDVTVLDAKGLYSSEASSNRLLSVNNNLDTIFVRIDGMTFRNGSAVEDGVATQGGAIFNTENLLLKNVSIYGSKAIEGGGAIYNNGGYLYIERSEIYNNIVLNAGAEVAGGAIYNTMGQVRITESTLRSNIVNGSEAYGGAIYSYDDGTGTSAVTIISSAIYDNIATGTIVSVGGALLSEGSNQIEITNSTMAHNTAEFGGAMYFAGGGTYKFTNITVAYNETSDVNSSAVVFDGGTLYVINSLFLANYNNGVQLNQDIHGTLASSSVFNSAYNFSSAGYFADTRIADHGGWSYTIALAAGSNAIDAGMDSGVPNSDQRGYETNYRRDMGAYEYNGYVAYYWYADTTDPFWIGTSTISAAGAARMSNTDVSEHVIRLVNTRILESDITINSWRYGEDGVKPSRVVSIYGHQEGGTVIDAGYQGQIFNITGERYTVGSTTTYVMGTVNINRVTMTNGFTTGNGGAITTTQASDGGVINVNDSTITNNVALGEGGAIYSHGADASWGDKKDATYNLNNSLIAYNISAGSGGAISIVKTVNVSNSTLAYNRSFADGGAIMVNENGGGGISYSTVSFNKASTNGGGIYLANGYSIGNTILAKNRTTEIISAKIGGSSLDPDYESGYDYYWEKGTLANGGHNLVEYQNGHWIKSDATNFFGPKSETSPYGISNGDVLGPKEYLFSNEFAADHGGWSYTIELSQNSAALDKGSGDTVDQRGYSANRSRDIGAFELNGIVATVNGQGYSAIEEAVASASSGDTITLVGARILGHDINVGKDITIQTASTSSYYSLALIDAKNYGRIFAVEGSSVTLSLANMILTNGTILIGSGQGGQQAAGNGGAIFNAGTLNLSEVSISESFSQLSGGAIYSTKALNISTNGINETASSVTHSRGAYIARNSAQGNGGGIYTSNSFSVTGLSMDGSGDYYTEDMVHFDYNFANAGGAIYLSYVVNSGYVLDGAQLVGNNATTRGGAIYMLANSDVTFNAVSFEQNAAMRYGGAMYTETTNALTFRDVDFENNFTFSDGGAVYYDGLGNSKADLTYYNSARFNRFTFWANNNSSLKGSGGAFYVKDANKVHIYSTSLTANLEIGGNQALLNGGAIFVDNTGTGTDGYGIIIGKAPGVDTISNQIYIHENMAGQNGGAIYMSNSGHFYACENVEIYDNIAGANPFRANASGLWNIDVWTGEGKGGGIFVKDSGDFTYKFSCSVYGNTARNFGGAFYLENNGLINIDYTEFGDNAAGEYYLGYWLNVAGDYTNVAGDIIPVINPGQGGALYFKGSGNVAFTDLDFYDNHAVAEGGAVYIENGANEDRCITINTSSFDRNIIDGSAYGGALYVDHAKAFNIADSSFAFNDNTALYLGYGSLSLNFTTFAYNTNSAGVLDASDALGIYLAGETGKTSAFVVNNSILHDGATSTGYRFGDTVSITGGQSTNNIYTYFDNFAGASGLSVGTLNSIIAYLPYGDNNGSAAIRDSYGNLVGTSDLAPVSVTNPTAITNSEFISQNLYLSNDMDYAGGRRTRTLALESVNSIASRYEYNGNLTYAGDISRTVSYDRNGTLKSGLILIDNITDIYNWRQSGQEYYSLDSVAQKPLAVSSNGVGLTEGTLGSLKVGEWAWDTENNRVVVRLADDASPNTTAMKYRDDTNYTVIYDQRGNMRSGIVIGDSFTNQETGWTSYSGGENEYQASSEYEVTGVSSDGVALTEGTDIDNLEVGQWIWDADNKVVVIKLSETGSPSENKILLTTEQTSYTYYTYGKFDTDGNSETAPVDSWIKVSVSEDGTTYRTAASSSDVHAGIGAFKENLYMTVTTNADNSYNPEFRYNYAEFSYMNEALTNGVTLREAISWIDTYDMTDLDTNVTNAKFDAGRYVKFADSMFANGRNHITLQAAWDSAFIVRSDVVIGMIDKYNDYHYTDLDGTTHYFEADNSFLAQSDANRIIIDGNHTSRIFDNYYHDDKSEQSGHWYVSATVGLNNLTLTNGYVTANNADYVYHNGLGGAIYNASGSEMYLNNTVVENSTVTNTNTVNTGTNQARGGGIYNTGTMTIQDSTIIGNYADGTNSRSYNAGQGGGIYNNGTMTVIRSLVADNHVKSLISKQSYGNDSATGGGIFSIGTFNMYSSTVSGNYIDAGSSESVDGAAIAVRGGSVYLEGNTIAYNKAYDGSGQEVGPSRPGYAVLLQNGSVTLRNNILAQNYIAGDTEQNRRDIIVSNNVSFTEYNNIIGSYYQASGYYDFALDYIAHSDILGTNASGLVADLNMSSELLYNGGMTQNYRIQTGSRAISAGNYSSFITYDQRNAVEGTEYANRSTIGAYELITSITIDSDVADAALPVEGIAYDFTNNRGGWLVNLRNALYLADQGATVTVNVITDHETFTLVGGELLIFNGISLTTDGAILTIDGENNSRIFAITDPESARVVDVSLSNLKLINGTVAIDDRGGLGGAIYTTEGLTLDMVEIIDVTSASHGGAIYSLAGGLTLTDVSISNAEATNGDGGAINLQTDAFTATNLIIKDSSAGGSGGAIYITDGSSFSLTGTSEIHDNQSGSYGGGIYFRGGNMTITDAYIYDNAAASDKDGGGLYVNSSGTISVTNSTFGNSSTDGVASNGNTAARGAGIFVYAGNLMMNNSTISGNTANKDGGGLYFDGSNLSLTYVTIANNYAGEGYRGGGVYMNNGSLTMINTVIAQNYENTNGTPASDFYLAGGASVSSATYSAIGQSNYNFYSHSNTNITGWDTGGVIDNLGLDTTLYDNGGTTPTLYVMSNSALVGKGFYIAGTSQNGRVRVDSPTIGAYEGGSTTYYYIGGDVNAESSWNTAADGSGTTLADGGFEDADNKYVFTNNGHAGDFSTGTWEISDRSFVTVAAGGMFTISGDAVVRAFVHRTPTTQANMVVNVESSGNLTFNTGVAQSVTLTTLDSGSNVNYTYAGDQTVYTATYGNLTISGTGTKTAEEVITVDGNMANSSTLTSGYNLTVDGNLANSGSITAVDITVNGNTTGTGSLIGTNVYLNGTSNNISGDVTASDDLTFAGGTSTGTLAGTTVNAEGTVANVNATTLNSTSLAVTGTVNTTDLNVTTLGLSNDASVTTVNANLATINSTGGSNTLKATAASTSDVNYTSWVINASGNSTLAIDRGSNDILISENGSVTDSFNINNMDVDSGSTVKFITEGNASLTDIDSAALAGTYDGTLWIKSVDISLPGCDFSGGNMSLVIENSGYFDLVAGTTLTFGKSININNVRIVAGLPSATLATLASTSGDVSIGNVVSLSPTYSIFLNAANGSTTIGGASGITNVIMNAANTATSDGAIDILGNFDATAATVTIQNDVTVGGSVSVTGDLVLGADIAADGNVGVSGTTTLSGDSSISGDTLTLSGAISDSGTNNLTLEATGIGVNSLPSVNVGGNLTILDGIFTTDQDATSANFELQSPATMTFTDGALATGNLTNAGNLILFDPAAVSGNLNNSGILASGDVSIDGNLINTGTFNSTGSLIVLGDIINTSTNTLSAVTLNASGNIDDTGAISVTNLVLKNNIGLGAAVNDICFSDGTTFDTFTVEADKHVRLVDGNIIVGNFVFAADASPTSTFEISSGTSVTVNNSINYNVAGANYDGHYFIVSNDSELIQTMNNTDVLYRLANSGYVTEVTLNTGAAGVGEKIAVGIINNVTVAGDTVSGIEDTVKFTTVIDRNYGGGSYTGGITLGINWDINQEGTGFVPANADLFSYGNGEWTTQGTVTVTTPSAGRHAISGFVLPHNGMYTIANADAEMTVPPLPNNVNIYEMANAHYIPMYPDLDTNIFLNFPVGFYPYYVSDRYFSPSNLHSVGQAAYRQMEYRWITNPETNILGGQVPPPGAVLGQAITEQASLTLTSDAPVYLEVNGEYSVGKGWVPITEPASVENIEQYQEPVTQGQIDQFYLDFGQREDIFDKPLSFKSDLDEMLDNLLAG